MAARKMHMNLIMILMAIGLPALIFYNIFFSGPAPRLEIAGFDDLRQTILEMQSVNYRIHSVQNDRGVVRVNIVLALPPLSDDDIRVATLNVLYDLQSLIGRKETLSVWSASEETPGQLQFQGMAFFSAITENTHFKSANELR